jgi:hypothetical protein
MLFVLSWETAGDDIVHFTIWNAKARTATT